MQDSAEAEAPEGRACDSHSDLWADIVCKRDASVTRPAIQRQLTFRE